MAKRLDPDIRELAEKMQTRRNEATKRVAAGELMHVKFMGQDAIEKAAFRNLAGVAPGSERGLDQLADVGNYGLALIANMPRDAEGAEKA